MFDKGDYVKLEVKNSAKSNVFVVSCALILFLNSIPPRRSTFTL